LRNSRLEELPISLEEAAERLQYFGEFARFALDDRLGTGRVPAFAYRSDVSAMMHDHIEHLLAKAHSVYAFSAANRILAYYRVSSEQEADALFGPRSNWRSIEWNARGLEIEFTAVVVDWPKLYESLRESGKWQPADETKAALRKVGQWSDSWEPMGSGPADEAPQGEILRPGPKGGEQSVDQLAWQIALRILGSRDRPSPGHGRLIALARMVNTELKKQKYQRQDDSIRRGIGPSLRTWEAKNPGK
jgi:hypothetical protein